MADDNVNDIECLKKNIAEIVADVAGIDISESSSNLSEWGMDSMMLLDILTVIEKEFDIVLNEEVTKEFTSITHIAYVVQHALRNLESPSRRRSVAPH